jgi:D-apiose dehydrogenase
MGKPPVLGVAGAGYFAQFHLEAWQRLHAQGLVDLAALAEPDPVKRRAAACKYGIPREFASVPEMVEAMRIDVLDIATPPATHLELVETAARQGIACISQKPLAPTYAEAQQLVDVAERAAIPLAVHENFRWMPWYREMKRCLDSGLIGTPYTVSVRMRPGDGQGSDAYLGRQPYFQKMKRFFVHETAIHFIDSFRFLFGEITSVSAVLRRLNPVIASALIDGNRLNDHPAKNTRLTMGEHWLEGSNGVLRLDGDGRLFWKPHGQAEAPHPYAWDDIGFAGDCVYHQQKHLIEAFAAGREPVNTGRAYLRNYAIEEAVYRSHEERRQVDTGVPHRSHPSTP